MNQKVGHFMKIIIDRFEGEYAVVEMEDRTMVNLPRVLLPGAKEGDIIRIEIDVEETEKRKREMEKRMDALWE